MKSLRSRLFVILVAATSVIWLVALFWIYIETKREIEGVLDARLQEAARMVASLVSSDITTASKIDKYSSRFTDIPNYERQLSCQIWSLDGQLVARTSGAPDISMSDARSGFSEQIINGESWRVFTIEDLGKGVRILVGDRLGLRGHLVAELIKGLLTPVLLIIPILGFLIWTCLNRGLRPLWVIAQELQTRNAEDMSPIATGRAPTEIQPLVAALNELFAKVKAARQHEREITAFAAHELRTPLAGLRTQAQISIAATDKNTRETALRQIVIAVDRTSRLVRQLLAISKLDTIYEIKKDSDVNLGELIEEIVEVLSTSNEKFRVIIEPSLKEISLTTNKDLLHLALRNLHENAVGHMSKGGTIRWSGEKTSNRILIFVEDEGPGIPLDEMHLVTHRFFRGRHKSSTGSGLGLSIVDLAVRAIGAGLALKNREDAKGLRAEINWYFQNQP